MKIITAFCLMLLFCTQLIQNETCSASATNCSSCVTANSQICDVCNDGFYLSGIECKQCSARCSTCMQSIKCTACKDGFYLQNEVCILCLDGCSKCSSATICTQCKFGFFSQGDTKCTACSNNCSKCIAADDCISCSDGFYRQGKTCKPCKPECKTCSSGNHCTSCPQTGYYIQDPRTCVACVGNCKFCTPQDKCSFCLDGFFQRGVAGDRNCSDACSIANCRNCSAGLETCSGCKVGFFGQGRLCNPCINGCEVCQSSTTCIRCLDGFYIQSNMTCSKCTLHACFQCKSPTTCQTCLDGFYLIDSSTCRRCPDRCQTCTQNQCKSCSGFVTPVNGTCPCSIFSGCKNCTGVQNDADYVCHSCKDQFFSNISAGTCHTCPTGCKTCLNDTGVCTQCTDANVSAANGSCGCPIINCTKCYGEPSDSANYRCDMCINGYYGFGPACAPCPVNCATCNFERCLTCVNGTTMFNNLCGEDLCGSAGCQTCVQGRSDPICSSCKSEQYISTFSCFGCPERCQFCAGNENCTKDCSVCDPPKCQSFLGCLKCINQNQSNISCMECQSSYFLIQGRCVKCTEKCRDPCTHSVSCTKVNGTNCVAGIFGCMECDASNNSTCMSCSKGYYLNQGTCSKCSQGCEECVNNSFTCTKCYEGSMVNASVQFPSPCSICSSLEGCIVCADTNICTQCSKFFNLVSGRCIPCPEDCSECRIAFTCQQCAVDECKFNGSCITSPDASSCFFKNTANKTVICSPGCRLCTSATQCQVCDEGFMLVQTNGKKHCQLCDNSCQTCSNSSACESCAQKQLLVNGICTPCQDFNCQQCKPTIAICALCQSGYTVVNNQCQKCTDPYCFDCTTNFQVCQVDGCQQGFALTPNNNLCEQCVQGCSNCSGSNITNCLQCSNGLFLSNDKCVKCPDNCQGCESAEKCTSCLEDYKLQGNQCIKACNFPCQECQKNLPNQCLSCFVGYNLATNQCQEDIACNTNNTCTSCPLRYALVSMGSNFTCMNCNAGTNCRRCSNVNVSICMACESGFYPLNGVCVACQGQNCLRCNSVGKCTKCSPGFLIERIGTKKTGTCIACQSNCKTCLKYPTKCLSCNDTSTLRFFKCITNKNIGFSIVEIHSLSFFLFRVRQFRLSIMFAIGIQSPLSFRRVTLLSVTQGSTLIDGQVNVPDNEDITSASTRLQIALTSGSKIGNFTIASSSVTRNGQQESSSNGVQLAIILGITIPLFLAIVALVIGLLYRRRKKDQTTSSKQNQTSNLNPTSKDMIKGEGF